MPEEKKKIMTTDAGRPVGDNQNSLTVGPRGPVVFEDFSALRKDGAFNRERIPERVVHAKGSGAYGHFVCTKPRSPSTRLQAVQHCRQEDADFIGFRPWVVKRVRRIRRATHAGLP